MDRVFYARVFVDPREGLFGLLSAPGLRSAPLERAFRRRTLASPCRRLRRLVRRLGRIAPAAGRRLILIGVWLAARRRL